jgi:hypothetical protein
MAALDIFEQIMNKKESAVKVFGSTAAAQANAAVRPLGDVGNVRLAELAEWQMLSLHPPHRDRQAALGCGRQFD